LSAEVIILKVIQLRSPLNQLLSLHPSLEKLSLVVFESSPIGEGRPVVVTTDVILI
jgi:hypothetical protein